MSEKHFCSDNSLQDCSRSSCDKCKNQKPSEKNSYRGKGDNEFIQTLKSSLPEGAGPNHFWEKPLV